MPDVTIDAVKFRIDADDKPFVEKLDKAEKNAERAGQEIGGSLGKGFKDGFKEGAKGADDVGKEITDKIGGAFKAAASIFAGAKVFQFLKSGFSEASAEANRFEAAVQGLNSTTKAFGQDTDEATDAVKRLTKDGLLTFEQGAQTIKNLLATGLNVSDALAVAEGLKDTAAFNRTIDDFGEAVTTASKGLRTNSIELIENAGITTRLGAALERAGFSQADLTDETKKGAAVEALKGIILKDTIKFQGDANKLTETAAGSQAKLEASTKALNVELGSLVNDFLAPIRNVVSGVVNALTDFFGGLNKGTKQILLIGAALAVLGPTINGVFNAFKDLSKGVGIIGSIVKAITALNPVVLILAGLTAAITAAAAIFSEFADTAENFRKNFEGTKEEISELTTEIDELSKVQNKSAEETERLTEAREDLNKILGENGISLTDENGKLRSNFQLTEALRKKKLEEARARIVNIQTIIKEIQERTFAENLLRTILGENIAISELGARQRLEEFKQIVRDLEREGRKRTTTLKKQDKIITDSDDKKNKKIKENAIKANDFLLSEFEKRVAAERKAFEEFQKFVIASTKKNTKERLDLLEKAGAEFSKRFARIVLDTVSNLTTEIGGVIQTVGEGAGFGDVIAGTGAAVSTIDPVTGGIVSSIGQIASVFEDLFDNTEDLRMAEEARAKIAEEQSRQLEKQVQLAETLRGLELERLQLRDSETERQLLLNKLTITDTEARKKADLEAIQSLARIQAQQAGLTGDVGEAVSVVTNLQRQQIQDRAALSVISSLSTPSGDFQGVKRTLEQNLSALNGIDRTGISSEVSSIINGVKFNIENSLSRFRRLEADTTRSAFDRALGGQTLVREAEQLLPRLLTTAAARGGAAQAETQATLNRAEAFLQTQSRIQDLLGNIDVNTEKTADNTVSLREDRATSFIDIFRGTINSLGQIVNPQMGNVALPESIQTMTLATTAAKSVQERMAEGIEDLVTIQKDARILLASIAASLDNNPGTDPASLQQQVNAILADNRERGLN